MIQGFTTAVTNVTGVLRVDVRLSGAGEDPHVEGIVDVSGGAFEVPSSGVAYSRPQHEHRPEPRLHHHPELVVTDEEGETLNINGTLGVHAREVGAVDLN